MNEDISQLPTEAVNPLTADLSRLPVRDAMRLINEEDAKVAPAVGLVLDDIAAAVTEISARLGRGGRLFYIGAGTSGRLGVVDASECPPTFGTPPELVQAFIAGGHEAMFRSQEGAEDDANAGAEALAGVALSEADAVIGIAASGRTPYVIGALRYARGVEALTIGLTLNAAAPLKEWCDIFIAPQVGPEAIAGSTRMKAGTAQKLVLNMISTGVMLQLGRVDGNRMTDLRPLCGKLISRALRLVMDGTGVDETAAEAALEACGGNARRAIDLLKGKDK